MKLVLDTNVLIDAERDNEALEQRIGDEDDVAMAAITAAELLVGVELADRRRRDDRQRLPRAGMHRRPPRV